MPIDNGPLMSAERKNSASQADSLQSTVGAYRRRRKRRRKAGKLAGGVRMPSASVPPSPKPRFKAKQTVDDATMDRTYKRLNRLSKMGVDTSKLAVNYDGSGRQSRKIKRLLASKKKTYSI